MPANLSPDYKKAEKAFRDARDEPEHLVCLKEMLRTIPKHNDTESPILIMCGPSSYSHAALGNAQDLDHHCGNSRSDRSSSTTER